MKKVYNYWMPESDNHFERLIAKRIKQGGPAQYQDDVRDEAYKYVTDFNIAVDVGANVGLWAKPLTSMFDRVIAFEPLEQVYSCLEINVQGLQVEIHKHALGSVNDNVEMVYNAENTGSSFVSEIGSGSIKIKRLDDLNLPKFGLLKIDCEGHELEVIKGGQQTILKYKPIVVVEQHPESKYCAATYLRTLGATEISKVRKDFIFAWK
jgi:FkbM family methyltransferase